MREPLLVLDADFRVRSANRSFYQVFGLKKEAVENQGLYEIADREWDLPELHQLLEEILGHRSRSKTSNWSTPFHESATK